MTTQDNNKTDTTIGEINLNHLSKGTLHILSIAMSPPNVGFTRLVTPSPI